MHLNTRFEKWERVVRCKMVIIGKLKEEFQGRGGILKTSELNEFGLSSRQIKRLVDDGVITRIKHGFYELAGYVSREEAVIARLFPHAIIFLESALLHHSYTDRIPVAWQIAVDKNSTKSQYAIEYPLIEPFYLEPKLLQVGIDKIKIEGIAVKIYNRDRTICDVLRYETKLEKEVFNNAIQRYIKDRRKNVRRLFEYAEVFNIRNKVQTYIGVWL
jgi:predicted transcriptional regulator of viral defense system